MSSINRTLVELKHISEWQLRSLWRSINRTLVELKQISKLWSFGFVEVYQSYLSGIKTSNYLAQRPVLLAINRTLVELKPQHREEIWWAIRTINRTLVELKQ